MIRARAFFAKRMEVFTLLSCLNTIDEKVNGYPVPYTKDLLSPFFCFLDSSSDYLIFQMANSLYAISNR